MKQRFVLYSLLLAMGIMVFMGCEDDEVTPEEVTGNIQDLDALTADALEQIAELEAIRDSLEALGGAIDFSVQLAVANGKAIIPGGRTSGDEALAGVQVAISQFGEVQTVTTDQSGIAAFSDLRIGGISVSITADNLSDVELVAEITAPGSEELENLEDGTLAGVKRSAAIWVPLFSPTGNTANINGRITWETDLTNGTPEVAPAGVTVVGAIDDEEILAFLENPSNGEINGNTDDGPNGDGTFDGGEDSDGDDLPDVFLGGVGNNDNAGIVNIAYGGTLFSATTDENGEYSLDVPALGGDGIDIKLSIAEVAGDQTLLLDFFNDVPFNDVITTRAVFSGSFSLFDISDVPTPKDLPEAKTIIDAPTGDIGDLPDTEAEARAILAVGGIVNTFIEDMGSGFTQPPKVSVLGDAKVEADITAEITHGMVSSLTIVDAGKGYEILPGDTANLYDLDFDLPVDGDDIADFNGSINDIITYSVTSIDLDTMVRGFDAEPDVLIISPEGGFGADARAVITGVVDDIEVTNPGIGYTAPPDVDLIGSASETAMAIAVLTEFNPIHSIVAIDTTGGIDPEDIDGNGEEDLFTEAPEVKIERRAGGTGSGARANVILSESGELVKVNIVNPGSGYDQDPTVIIAGGGGFGAVAEAEIDNGQVVRVTVLESGEGYTSTPTVEIAAPINPSGVQAVGEALVGRTLEGFEIVNPGQGYDIVVERDTMPNGVIRFLYGQLPGVSIVVNETNNPTVGENENGYAFDYIVRPNASIDDIELVMAGEGYTLPPGVVISPVFGFGFGAEAASELTQALIGFDVVDGGAGYPRDPAKINIVVETPVSADKEVIANANVGNGVLDLVALVGEGDGSGYTAPPIATLRGIDFDNDGDSLVLSLGAIVNGGAVTALTSSGSSIITGLDASDNLEISITTHTGSMPVGFALSDAGQIVEVIMENPGAGYSEVPPVLFIPADSIGGGTGAEGVAILENGRIIGVDITNPGSGYVEAPDVVFDISTYLKTAILWFDDKNNNGMIEHDPNGDSVVTELVLEEPGNGYVTSPAITVMPILDGAGTDAAIKVVKLTPDGKLDLKNLVVTNRGSGYFGRNTPGTATAPIIVGGNGSSGDPTRITVVSQATYVRDIYLGTGKRVAEASEGSTMQDNPATHNN